MEALEKYTNIINQAIAEHFDTEKSILHRIGQESVIEGGKRIRGLLCLLACELGCGDHRPAIPVAVGYELYHAASLIQDDIIDNSDERRGQPSLLKKYGLNRALLISDFLLFELNNILAAHATLLSPQQLSEILAAFGECAQLATLGEYLDLEIGDNENSTLDDYIKMVEYKTGALISAATISGGIVGGASKEEIQILRTYAENHGIAYQIYDDLLDITGDPKKIGKPVFNDLAGGKKNLVIFHLLMCLDKAQDPRKANIQALVKQKGTSEEDKQYVRDLLAEFGSVEYARELADKYCSVAMEGVHKLQNEEVKQTLITLSEYLSTRYY